ncbi:MAG: glutamate--tRNA ligase [Parcubacteria group bacterium]|nr:glutamate--tRNA ligase [Parcubacteria group bacterium]
MPAQTKSVRTRFAPSPTGEPHVGNIRTALFAWLFARHSKGTFILRIEDTDQTREEEGSLSAILSALEWLGIDIDEGVVAANGQEKGDKGPYTQSKRLETYQHHAKQLVDRGKAFYCFCSTERLAVLRELQESRKEPPRYDGRCSRLEPDEVEKHLADKTPHVIRMRVPSGGETKFYDAVKGEISFKNANLDCQVLLKSDGFPTYHLASVVDDHLMAITHVIRADEWLPSTPKHALLYQYFGWEAPVWVHLPIILGTDKSKLSKRNGAVSVLEYQKDYVPDALVNYLALLGWNPKTEQEVLSRGELIEQFDLAKINKGNPIFDVAKLNWLNNQYLKKMPAEELAGILLSLRGKVEAKSGVDPSGILGTGSSGRDAFPPHDIITAVKLAQDRMEKLSDFRPLTEFLWKDELVYDPAILIPKQSDARLALEMLATALNLVRNIHEGDWDEESIRKTFFEFCESSQIGKGELLWPLRVAVTGLERSPDVFGVMGILGRKKTLERVIRAQKLLA